MPSTQELTRRIKSAKGTRKITRAMQMISAAKMRKSQQATLASRTYAGLAWQLINALGAMEAARIPLLQQYPNATKVGVILITTNRGLVGGFNANLINKLKEIEAAEPELISEMITIGKKGREAMIRSNRHLLAEFTKHDTTEHIKEIYPIVKLITNAYETGEYKKIIIVYNHFVSTLQQQASVKTVLPFTAPEESSGTDTIIFEPGKEAVLTHLLPRILESQVYQLILENDASEHSARMLMMKNATDAAGDLIDDLTLTFNQLRQNKITTELSEITAGRISLEG